MLLCGGAPEGLVRRASELSPSPPSSSASSSSSSRRFPEPELQDSFQLEEGVFPQPRLSDLATLEQRIERAKCERDEALARAQELQTAAAADALEMLTKIDRLEKALAVAKAPKPFSASSPFLMAKSAKALAPKAKVVLQDRTNA